ncbi:MAG: MFS transporter, partial [Gammaproteobacteria bacterium]
PVGLLWFSSLFALIGLYLLSIVDSPLLVFMASTIWGVGVCYMYPTMVATASERYPRGGAFVMGIMGFAAGMAIQFVLPIMGTIYDEARIMAAGSAEALSNLTGEELVAVTRLASTESFQAVAVIPAVLLPIFALIWWHDRRTTAEAP